MKRYNLKAEGWAYMDPSEDGDYVHHEDAARIETQRDRLLQTAIELRAFREGTTRYEAASRELDAVMAEVNAAKIVDNR